MGPKSHARCGSSRGDDDSPTAVVREGTTLAVGRDVAVPAAVAAESLRDTLTWPQWGPAIDAVESDDRYVRSGTTGRVSVAGAWLPFRVTGCNGRRWDWRIAGIPSTGHRVDRYANDPDRCRVVVEVPVVAVGYVPTCREALGRFAALVEDAQSDGDETTGDGTRTAEGDDER